MLRVRVSAMWLEAVKMYGNRPRKLLVKINKKPEMKIVVDPLNADGPRRVLNSVCSFLVIVFITIVDLLLIAQKEGKIILIMVSDLSQLRGRLIIEDEGSNTEKRFVIIIFNLRGFFY